MVRVKVRRKFFHHRPKVLGRHYRKNYVTLPGQITHVIGRHDILVDFVAAVFTLFQNALEYFFIPDIEQYFSVPGQDVCDHGTKVPRADYSDRLFR